MAKLRKRRVDAVLNTLRVQKTQWAFTIIEETVHTLTISTYSLSCPLPWMEDNEDYFTQLEVFQTL